MKRSFFGIAAIAAMIGTPALAADMMPLKAPPPPLAWSWSGFYIGANVGYAWGTSTNSNPFFASPTTGNFRTSGFLGGAQLGYNLQLGAWVLGFETDIDGSGLTGSTSNGICATVVCTTSETWLGTTRARLGFAADHWLFYGTGGIAYGNIKFTDLPAPSVVNGSATNVGWTGGGGTEYAFTRKWSAKVEYLYVNLGSMNLACTPGCGTSATTLKENIVRGGLNYHF